MPHIVGEEPGICGADRVGEDVRCILDPTIACE